MSSIIISNLSTSIEQLILDARMSVVDGLFKRLSDDMEMGEAEHIFSAFKTELLTQVPATPLNSKKAVAQKDAKGVKVKKPPTSYNIFIGIRLKELKILYPHVKHDKVMQMIPKKTWDPVKFKEYHAVHVERVRTENVDATDARLAELLMMDFMKTVEWTVPDMSSVSVVPDVPSPVVPDVPSPVGLVVSVVPVVQVVQVVPVVPVVPAASVVPVV